MDLHPRAGIRQRATRARDRRLPQAHGGTASGIRPAVGPVDAVTTQERRSLFFRSASDISTKLRTAGCSELGLPGAQDHRVALTARLLDFLGLLTSRASAALAEMSESQSLQAKGEQHEVTQYLSGSGFERAKQGPLGCPRGKRDLRERPQPLRDPQGRQPIASKASTGANGGGSC